MPKILATALLIALLLYNTAEAQRYHNCKALNAVYSHGVGYPGAVDRSRSQRRVIGFCVAWPSTAKTPTLTAIKTVLSAKSTEKQLGKNRETTEK
jgi:hypothetical protein